MVAITSVGDIPGQVQDGTTGFLTPPRDAEAMAARVVQLIEDEELRLRKGGKRFDIEMMAEKYLGGLRKSIR